MIQPTRATVRRMKFHTCSTVLFGLFKEDLELNLDEEDLEFLKNVEVDGVYTFSQDWA